MKKILVTGGNSRFAKILKKIDSNYKFFFVNKKQLDITKIKSIKNSLRKNKPWGVLHLAGLSRPMILHEKNISKSISLNIIGTCNLVNECERVKTKLIYFSTSYVYPGKKGSYKEQDPVYPWNNYAWSKLGGECAVQMYNNSLILRVCMTEKPFIHKEAYTNVKTNFIYHEDLAKILVRIIEKKGIINIGGKSQSIYNFAKKDNKKIKKKISKGEFPLLQDMSLIKLKSILSKKS
jgi:dTDP-4-dehydrorhamnose reductase